MTLDSPRRIPRGGVAPSEDFLAWLKSGGLEPAASERGPSTLRRISRIFGASPAAPAARSSQAQVRTELTVPTELGVYVSSTADGRVRVQLDSTGEVVSAAFWGFSPGFEPEAGDELCVEFVDEDWRTIPSVKFRIEHPDRIELWTVNRSTGAFRLLSRLFFESEP